MEIFISHLDVTENLTFISGVLAMSENTRLIPCSELEMGGNLRKAGVHNVTGRLNI